MAVKEDFGIKGFIPLSMLDWDGRLVTTIFMGGCNFRCPFCHNSSLVLENDSMPDVSINRIEKVLVSKYGWVDGVCITGGEPTINGKLPHLLEHISNLNYQVKLDTNGTQPNIIQKLIENSLISAIAVDIKTSFHKYAFATQKPDLSDRVKKSIELLIDSEDKGKLEVYFRTTVVPTFVEREDVLRIAQHLGESGAKHYTLQQFNPKTVMLPAVSNIRPFTHDFLEELAQEASKLVPTQLRN